MAQFEWECHPKAEAWLMEYVNKACHQNAMLATLQHDLLEKTSTRLFDWLDHLVIDRSNGENPDPEKYGYVLERVTNHYSVYNHPAAQFPRVIVLDGDSCVCGLALSVDSIADFLLAHGVSSPIEGTPFSGYRRCCVNIEKRIALWVIERRGTMIMEPTVEEPVHIQRYFAAKERWMSRPRGLENEEKNFQFTIDLAQSIVSLLGRNEAACLVLECERQYWQIRNTAGQLQKNRQDRLGMGWANHDHHTFRSSRHHFSKLVRLFEILGFHCRERFYAGKQAGWGAQVMENPACKLVLFLDVDLHENEIKGDFAHEDLPDLPQLGTIGLWCALHGDSLLKAGMHHLEAQFMFEELKEKLHHLGVGMMDPFSNFPYLKQAFTAGEMWHVDPKRVQIIVAKNLITPEHAEKFLKHGVIGSHLENLQRREGYKGFNQNNVSVIIKKTDPRFI